MSEPFAPAGDVLTYATLCSGIEGVSLAWEPLGCYRPAFFCEIEPFCSAVLEERWPHVLNLGDLTKANCAAWRGRLDVLWASTPCQSFSFAGRRKGLKDKRGRLTLAFLDRVDEIEPTYVTWENVKGVLSDKSNAFGCLLGALAGENGPLVPPGGKWSHAGYVLGPKRAVAWRLFDAQHGGLPQRRERVFVVASLGNGADPRDILFEREGLRRDTPPRREKAAEIAPALTGGARSSAGYSLDDAPLTVAFGGNNTQGPIEVSTALNAHGGAHGRQDFETETFVVCATGEVTHALKAEGGDASEDGTGRGNPIIAFSAKDYGADATHDLSPTLRAMPHHESHPNAGGQMAIAYSELLDAAGLDALKGFGLDGLSPIAFDARQTDALVHGDKVGPLDTKFPGPAIAFSAADDGCDPAADLAPTLRSRAGASGAARTAIAYAAAMRGREGGADLEVGDEVAHAVRGASGGGLTLPGPNRHLGRADLRARAAADAHRMRAVAGPARQPHPHSVAGSPGRAVSGRPSLQGHRQRPRHPRRPMDRPAAGPLPFRETQREGCGVTSLLPLVSFEPITLDELNACLAAWGHKMGELRRPPEYGFWGYGLRHEGRLVAVTATSSLIRETCAGEEWLPRETAVELSRVCAAREHLNRVALRLWREFAFPAICAARGFRWAVSYQDAALHTGDLYRFDGWVPLVRFKSGAGDPRSGRFGRRGVVWGWHADPAIRAARATAFRESLKGRAAA